MLLYDTMPLTDFIINDFNLEIVNENIKVPQFFFNQFIYSHVLVKKVVIIIGCFPETDVHCFDFNKPFSDFLYRIEGFSVRVIPLW